MNPQNHFRRLGAAALIISTVIACPVGPTHAGPPLSGEAIEWGGSEVSRYVARPTLDIAPKVIARVKDAFGAAAHERGYLPPRSGLSSQWTAALPHAAGLLGADGATISRQPVLLDRSSGLNGSLDERIGESVHFADRPADR